MAANAKNERQLTRQRGAGTRDVEATDLGFDFGAGSRQERQLMRQRGAGNREIHNIDFGFAFATPSTVRGQRTRTRSKTPATATHQPAHARTTTAPPNDEAVQQNASSARSTTSRRILASTRDESGAQPPRKRRRLSELSNLTRATSVDLPFASISNNMIDEEQEPGPHIPREADDGFEHAVEEQYENVPTSPLFFPDIKIDASNDAGKENKHPGSTAPRPVTKKRKRKSIGQQSLFKKKRNSGTSNPLIPTPPETQEGSLSTGEPLRHSLTARRDRHGRRWSIASSEPPPAPSPISSPARQAPQEPEAVPEDPSHETSRSAPPKRRKKRKPIVKGKTKRRSSGAVASTTPQMAESIEEEDKSERNEEGNEDEDELNELSSDFDAEEHPEHELEHEQPRSARKDVIPSIRSRRFRQEEPEHFDVGDGQDADYTFLPDEATPEPTPAPKRAEQKQQQRTRRRRASTCATATVSRPTDAQKKSRSSKSTSRSTFPILTHRMINTHTLPTIAEESHKDDQHDPYTDADELTLPAPPTITTRANPNAVDVLAQVCREAIDTSVSALKSQSLPCPDLTRRLTALESFRASLDHRLFDLSQSLDQRLTMEARLRKVRREKAELQARWLEIRRQRDQLDVKKDAVRRRHWEGEVLSGRRFEVSEAAFEVEAAVEEEREEGDNLEFMLRGVGENVSSVRGGGVLNMLKGFNAQLERLAGSLG